MRHSAIAVFAGVALILVGQTFGHSCPHADSCDPAKCDRPTGCVGGVVTDICDCCEECARVKNETCGGSFEMSGKCDQGLICVKPAPKKPGQQSSGNEEGICLEPPQSCIHPWLYSGCNLVDGDCLCTTMMSCEDPHFRFSEREDCFKERAMITASKNNSALDSNGENYLVKDCSQVQCIASDKCPDDSDYIPGKARFGECCREPGKCQCSKNDEKKCRLPSCLQGEAPVLQKIGAGKPGNCCNEYACQPIGANCNKSMCPEDTIKCPSDSYRLPSRLDAADGCCAVPQGCACLPCPPPPLCPLNTQLSVTVEKTEKPGACCSQFECIQKGCIAGGRLHQNGSIWSVGNCTTCMCVNRLSVCNTKTCPHIKNCSKMDTLPGECCPVCVGCVDQTGGTHNNNDTWMPDKCTTCKCIEGAVQCYAENCGPQVAEITFPPGCSPLPNCDLRYCVDGYATDDRNCFVCRCKQAESDDCNLKCEHGYVTDEDGNSLCQCAANDSATCLLLTDCHEQCPYGYQMDEQGCPTCTCERCKKLTSCTIKCPHGYHADDHGCSICRCKDGELMTTTEQSYIDISIDYTDNGMSYTTDSGVVENDANSHSLIAILCSVCALFGIAALIAFGWMYRKKFKRRNSENAEGALSYKNNTYTPLSNRVDTCRLNNSDHGKKSIVCPA